MSNIHVLYIFNRKMFKLIPAFDSNAELEYTARTSIPTGVVVHNTTEEEREAYREAYASSADMDTPDMLKWVEVTPVLSLG